MRSSVDGDVCLVLLPGRQIAWSASVERQPVVCACRLEVEDDLSVVGLILLFELS